MQQQPIDGRSRDERRAAVARDGKVREAERQIARLLADLEDELPANDAIVSVEVDLRAFAAAIGAISVEIITRSDGLGG